MLYIYREEGQTFFIGDTPVKTVKIRQKSAMLEINGDQYIVDVLSSINFGGVRIELRRIMGSVADWRFFGPRDIIILREEIYKHIH